MSKNTKLFVANWKMYGDTAMLARWAKEFVLPDNCRVVVCPPAPYLATACRLLPTAVGAQNICRYGSDGAHTGEMSARMVADVGGAYTIVGHSERRALGETDEECADKLAAAVQADLSPILCIGETAAERDNGQTFAALKQQLHALAIAAKTAAVFDKIAIAYEPMWAIGSGKTPAVDDLKNAQKYIREQLIAQTTAFGNIIPILYGGSVHPDNANMLGAASMNGGLVGGASLDAVAFGEICRQSGV
ncbi:MAG: triose-phosphate isomerase [Gammaproteobacteria bacterium WSBS_2016_MAG_OTU1]